MNHYWSGEGVHNSAVCENKSLIPFKIIIITNNSLINID